MKQVFLQSAIRVVAREGLDKATTKAIAKEAHLNEAYIYKCYSGKDELLNDALIMEDKNFADLLYETLPVMHDSRLPWKSRAFVLWKRSWDFILEEPDDCIFYIRFYFASRVMNGDLENNEETTLWTFEQIYCFIVPHVRPELMENEETLAHI